MTASFLTILAILRTFTFNSHKSIKHKTQLLLLYKEIKMERWTGSHMTTPMVYIPSKKSCLNMALLIYNEMGKSTIPP